MRRLVTHLLLLEVLVLLCVPQGAFAQRDSRSALDELDPDVAEVNPTDEGEVEPEAVLPELAPPPRSASAQEVQPARAQPPAEKERAKARKTLPPVKVTTRGDKELQTAWAAWRKANASLDAKGSRAALAQLVSLKEELSIDGLESFSVAVGRAAEKRLEAKDDVAWRHGSCRRSFRTRTSPWPAPTSGRTRRTWAGGAARSGTPSRRSGTTRATCAPRWWIW